MILWNEVAGFDIIQENDVRHNESTDKPILLIIYKQTTVYYANRMYYRIYLKTKSYNLS